MERTKYDDASWHYLGESFPKDLPAEAGATHIAMFVAWAISEGLTAGAPIAPRGLGKLRSRSEDFVRFFLDEYDGKFTSDTLNDEGNAFSATYYDLQHGMYLVDYENVLGNGLSDLYYVAATWDNFDALAPVVSERLREWRQSSPSHRT